MKYLSSFMKLHREILAQLLGYVVCSDFPHYAGNICPRNLV